MNFQTIRIEGNIISSDILEKILAGEELAGQKATDFGMQAGDKVKDEIARAWADAQDLWRIFRRRTEALQKEKSGNEEVRKYWMIPLLSLMDYHLETSGKEVVGNNSYAISHRDVKRDRFPVHIVGYQDFVLEAPDKRSTLDVKPSNATRRMSPHALVQEYLNLTEHSYALMTNGFQLRLLRDSSRLVKLSYLEFDLKQMMEEEVFADFAILFRLLHASRLPIKSDETASAILEQYHQLSLESGTRIREGLSDAVENSIKVFGNGFLKHPKNQALREALETNAISEKTYYQYLLRLIYRLLFLMVTEERQLIYDKNANKRKRDIYYRFYSIDRLRRLSERRGIADKRFEDLWYSLKQTFRLFESEKFGAPLDIKPLGGELFGPNSLGFLSQSELSNKYFLEAFKGLSVFINKNTGQAMRVNYSALNVEEFGSVYEGLLDYDPVILDHIKFDFKPGTGRGDSGSHYTPEELVQPLIKHSLDYIIEDKLKEADPIKALLSITVCDVACGSGHILLSAARKIAFKLACLQETKASNNQTIVEQPSPEYYRHALREVIRDCIYGVDLNPLAVELCKVALWLEAHNPGEPLNFLDHHIKCGNAIVGLAHREELEKGIADEAFKALGEDVKPIASSLLKKNKIERKERDSKSAGTQLDTEVQSDLDNTVREAMAEYGYFRALPENTPNQIESKQRAYQKFLNGKGYQFMKAMADIQVAQFYIPKNEATKDLFVTDSEYRQILSGYKGWQTMKTAKATAISQNKRFFHWFLEFPEVFSEGGFDCILGNPPFLGDRRLKDAYGENFLEWIRFNFSEGATIDLVVYFFLRINNVLREKGFQSLISTNTVAQGKAREFGLEKIIQNGSSLNHAVKGMRWPGLAAVEVSLITIYKGDWKGQFILNGKKTDQISPFLDEADNTGTPIPLFANDGKSYQGSIILGMGFVLDSNEAEQLIADDPININVIQPYLNGDDLNNNPDQNPSRYVINFQDWTEEDALKFTRPYKILLEKVKPERQRWKEDEEGNPIIGQYALRHPLPEKWWQHCEKRPALYKKINKLNRVLVSCRVSKYVNQSFVDVGAIFDVATSVVVRSEYWEYSFLQSSIHKDWAWKYGSTMKFDIRYTNRDCIDTFPILDNLAKDLQLKLETIGEAYHEHRKQLMLGMQLGLTKTYNLFHSKAISAQSINDKDKQVLSLQKHLEKTVNTISFYEAIKGILKLRELHMQMDEAVLEAYGWTDIQLRHDFYEVEYLSEKDRLRLTLHPDSRKEILKRLLELNHQNFEEEVKKGLHKKKDVEDYYEQKGQPVPPNTVFSDVKTKTYKTSKAKSLKVKEPKGGYGGLFK
ncbi:Eco57I restriction-modification methylase domain-containing protein [Aquiflexum gelatinilyticum]|uniref:Eco57I restriction-modification methylase domain-containing protein n=1 Tax=Aquiflexum gelatinilyticum TaxID=2961943 RepID=UPI002169BA99|nr:DNA methyltransferase [Aquiflexum gelatinilyticum]MCS4432864.1 restriction endonuclease [Aquiflexum gelatinilyticum]